MYISCGHQPRLPSQVSRVSALPNFRVLLYFFLHPLTLNDHVRLANTYGEGRVFRRSATPLRRARLSSVQLQTLKELHEKIPGVRNACSFRTAYAGWFAFEVNGEHGSVQG